MTDREISWSPGRLSIVGRRQIQKIKMQRSLIKNGLGYFVSVHAYAQVSFLMGDTNYMSMKQGASSLTLELSLSLPFSRQIVKGSSTHKILVKRLQSVLDEIGEEDSHYHNEINRLKKMQDDFLRGKYL